MFASHQLSARLRIVTTAALASALFLAVPVSSAAAAAPHAHVAQQGATSASAAFVPKVSLSASQRQAVIAAQGYLRTGIGFSYQGLLDQLTSDYGSGFSKKDATAAIKSLNPNWKKQAVISAKAYLKSGIGFSRDSLLDQLTSAYGGQFTTAQAKYAVKKVGL